MTKQFNRGDIVITTNTQQTGVVDIAGMHSCNVVLDDFNRGIVTTFLNDDLSHYEPVVFLMHSYVSLLPTALGYGVLSDDNLYLVVAKDFMKSEYDILNCATGKSLYGISRHAMVAVSDKEGNDRVQQYPTVAYACFTNAVDASLKYSDIHVIKITNPMNKTVVLFNCITGDQEVTKGDYLTIIDGSQVNDLRNRHATDLLEIEDDMITAESIFLAYDFVSRKDMDNLYMVTGRNSLGENQYNLLDCHDSGVYRVRADELTEVSADKVDLMLQEVDTFGYIYHNRSNGHKPMYAGVYAIKVEFDDLTVAVNCVTGKHEIFLDPGVRITKDKVKELMAEYAISLNEIKETPMQETVIPPVVDAPIVEERVPFAWVVEITTQTISFEKPLDIPPGAKVFPLYQ